MNCHTTKADIEESLNQVQVLCTMALSIVMSHTPIGLGEEFKAARDAMSMALTEAPATFERMVRKAQRVHGWAASNDE